MPLIAPNDETSTSTEIAGAGAASAISVLVLVSSFGAMSGIVLAGPRVYYAMAEDGLLFQWMGALHPRYRTPYIATIVQGIWASVLVLTGTYGAIVSRVVYTEWIFFGALALGVMRLRRAAGYTPAFRARGFPIVPVLFALTCLAIVVNQIVSDPRESLAGLALVLVGLPVYFVWRSLNGRDRLSQPLLPAQVHAGAAVGPQQRPRDDRQRR